MIQKKKALDNEECAAKLKHMVNQVHSNKMVFGKGKAQQSFSLLTVYKQGLNKNFVNS